MTSVDTRLHSFAQLTAELNAIHQGGSDVFGEMFMSVPPRVVAALAPDPPEDAVSPLTPTQQRLAGGMFGLDPLAEFVRKLEGEEKTHTAVDIIGRSKLDASMPIAAFESLHTLERELHAISSHIFALRNLCDEAERERKVVKALYENTAGSVETTYPEASVPYSYR